MYFETPAAASVITGKIAHVCWIHCVQRAASLCVFCESTLSNSHSDIAVIMERSFITLTPGRVQNLDPLAFCGIPSGPSTWGGSKWPKGIQLKMIGFAKISSRRPPEDYFKGEEAMTYVIAFDDLSGACFF